MGRGKRSRPKADDPVPPTPEQMADGAFRIEDITDKRNGGGSIAIGKAYRRRPMILTLLAQSVIEQDEYRALAHYRHHADMADRSPTKDSLNLYRGGGGEGPGVALLNAARVRDDCERAVGPLVDILRAIVVDDMTLSQWAIQKHGAIERQYTRKDRKGEIVQVNEIRAREGPLKRARVEIRVAAQRIMGEIDASYGTLVPMPRSASGA